MPPLEIAVWVIGALGLCGVALAFFKSDSLAVRLGALGVFGAFYISVLALGWGGVDWFNATTIAVVLIALMSRMKAPLAPKPAAEVAEEPPPAAAEDAELPADHDGPDAASSDRSE
jgi:hypothetical protein